MAAGGRGQKVAVLSSRAGARGACEQVQVGWLVNDEAWHLACAPTVGFLAEHYDGVLDGLEPLTTGLLSEPGPPLVCAGCRQVIAPA